MRKRFIGSGIAALGLVICAAGICIGETDDAPGAALIGILLMIGAIIASVKIAKGAKAERQEGKAK
jgi:hypothetical protein